MSRALKSWWQTLAGETKRRPDGRRNWAALAARGPFVVSVVLGLAIAAQAASLTAALLGDSRLGSGAGPGAIGRERDARGHTPPLTALSAITAAHLFGKAEVPMATAAAAAARTPLILTGVIATQDPTDGFAIIGSSAATARVFHAGSAAAPGVILAEVYPEDVVLLKGGQRVTLRLPRGTIAAEIGHSYGGMREGPAVATADTADAETPSPSSFKPPPASDGNTIISALSLRPVRGDERGARIMDTGVNSKALAALGLAPGDVITGINGVPVGSKGTPDIDQAIRQGGVTLTIDRDGGSTSVTIDPTTAATAAQDYRDSRVNL